MTSGSMVTIDFNASAEDMAVSTIIPQAHGLRQRFQESLIVVDDENADRNAIIPPHFSLVPYSLIHRQSLHEFLE
ncbi:MAG: hypothetical protein M3Z35_17205 [Nitrospirota bacterium]|nr:hypothetical protein [Nitrospirota bacterium]